MPRCSKYFRNMNSAMQISNKCMRNTKVASRTYNKCVNSSVNQPTKQKSNNLYKKIRRHISRYRRSKAN